MKESISTSNAPPAVGPYSQAIKLGNLVYVSGQLPVDPATGEQKTEIEAATKQVFANINAILTAAGSSLDNALKITVYMQDLSQFALMNQTYATFFTEKQPARSTVQVAKLPKDAVVEVDAIAYIAG